MKSQYELDDTVIAEKLDEMKEAICKAQKLPMFKSDSWVEDNNIPSEPGVYVIWDTSSGKEKKVYVGESSSLKSRMRNIGRTKNHTFRRMVKKALNITSDDETALSKEMSKRYLVSFIKVKFGRAELEEFLVKLWPEVWNKPAKIARARTTNG